MAKDFGIDLVGCLNCLQSDQVFLYPTDTIWGLGADATNPAAAQRIMELKNRPVHKSFVILVSDAAQLSRYVKNLDHRILDYLKQCRKPTTVIYPKAQGLAPAVMARDGSVAIRICKEPFCQRVLQASDKPLISTSANLSGQPTPGLFSEIDPVLIQGVDYVVKYRQKDNHRASASRIIKWHPEWLSAPGGPIEIIRA